MPKKYGLINRMLEIKSIHYLYLSCWSDEEKIMTSWHELLFKPKMEGQEKTLKLKFKDKITDITILENQLSLKFKLLCEDSILILYLQYVPIWHGQNTCLILG